MKTFSKSLSILFVLSVFCFSTVFAQEESDKTIKAGVVNGKALLLEKPEYPAAARAVNAEGAVNVKVVIDKDGQVTFAKTISGHPLLHNACETAALKSKFARTNLNGQPVIVEGIIVYKFTNSIKRPINKNIEDFSKFGQVLNSVALSLPAPKYPAAAKAVRAEGTVIVEIIVNKKGVVTFANAVSGHSLLLKEAEKAAMKAKFQPALENGKPVATRGVIVYKIFEQ